MNILIKVGSITNAQRSVKLLKANGYKAQLKRLEKPTKADGCGYAVIVYAQDDEPVSILNKGGINIRGVEYI